MPLFQLNTSVWSTVRLVFVFASMAIIASLVFFVFTGNVIGLYVIGFIGVMQGIFGLTGYCPMAIILDKLGASRGPVVRNEPSR